MRCSKIQQAGCLARCHGADSHTVIGADRTLPLQRGFASEGRTSKYLNCKNASTSDGEGIRDNLLELKTYISRTQPPAAVHVAFAVNMVREIFLRIYMFVWESAIFLKEVFGLT